MRLDLSALAGAPSPETAAFVAALRERTRGLPAQNEVPVETTRKARAEGRGLFPPGGPCDGAEWLAVPTPLGRVRVTRPEGPPRGVVLHIHGGGWTFGTPDQSDAANIALVKAAGVAVVSAPYRLGPENVWPACAEDVDAAARWLLREAEGLFGTTRLAIAGESAGAHLAAVTLLRLKETGDGGGFAAAALAYGCFDLRLTPSMARWGGEPLVLSTPVVEWFVDNLTGGNRALRADPALSPLLADLRGLPPTLLQVGTLDPLLDDSVLMAAALSAAGVEADLRLYPGGVHGFDRFPLPLADEANATLASFLRDRL